MSRIAKLVRAGSSHPLTGDGLAKRTMVGLSVAVVLLVASVAPAVSAGADQIDAAAAQAKAFSQTLTVEAGRIHTLTLAYEQQSTEAAALAQQVTIDRANIDRLRAAASATASALRDDAIISYAGGAAATGSGSPVAADPAVRVEYLQVAAGDLTDAIDRYRTNEDQLAAAEASMAAELRASLDAARATAGARQAALAQATAVQSQMVALDAELQHLEAEQAASRARTPAQGLPVNGGLVAVVTKVVSTGSNAGGVWLQLRECESGNNYRADTGNGFYGAYQFSPQTWSDLGYPGRPDLEPPAMQDQAAQRLQRQSGWNQWPACSAALGLS